MLISYPLKLAATASQHRLHRRNKRSFEKHNHLWRRRCLFAKLDKDVQHYRTVRIWRGKIDGHMGWWLVYGHNPTEGTGGFDTYQNCVAWFANGGR